GRRRLQAAEFERNPVGDLGLLAAGGHEQEILLPVVEESESGRRYIRSRKGAVAGFRLDRRLARYRRFSAAMLGEIRTNLVEGAGRDPGPVAQTGYQLAVVDDEPPEGGLGRLRRPAIVPYLTQNLIGGPRLSLTFRRPHD